MISDLGVIGFWYCSTEKTWFDADTVTAGTREHTDKDNTDTNVKITFFSFL